MMNKIGQGISAVLLGAVLTALGGCSVIMGSEDAVTQKGLSFQFIETLRNEASLRGESLRERDYGADPATTLQQPVSVYADAFRVYVVDRSPARVFLFNRGDRTVTILDGTPPPAEDHVKLLDPAGIVVSGETTIFVSDPQQGKVFAYDRNGSPVLTVGGTIGPMTMTMTTLSRPTGLALDRRRGRLYVADSNAQQVVVFSTLGDRLETIDGTGRAEEDFKFPGAVALDAQGNLFVLDTLRRRVFVFDGGGKFLKSFSLSGTVPGYAVQPKGLAVDSAGHLYVTDAASNNILIFDREGIFLFTWGRTGSLFGEFWTPSGIFIDNQDRIYIADRTNGRVQVFQYLK